MLTWKEETKIKTLSETVLDSIIKHLFSRWTNKVTTFSFLIFAPSAHPGHQNTGKWMRSDSSLNKQPRPAPSDAPVRSNRKPTPRQTARNELSHNWIWINSRHRDCGQSGDAFSSSPARALGPMVDTAEPQQRHTMMVAGKQMAKVEPYSVQCRWLRHGSAFWRLVLQHGGHSIDWATPS